MMIYEEPQISVGYQLLIKAFSKFEDSNFVRQVEFLGFDPLVDLRNIDLRGVDFSNCNLTGYDFSGSNLRGCIGVGTTWSPDTVNFNGADVDQSIFAHDLSQAAFFKDNPQYFETVERISGDYWANAISSLATILADDRNRDAGVQIAQAVFHRLNNLTVRTDALLMMRGIAGKKEHRDFIYNLLSRYSDSPNILLAAVRALASFYRRERPAFEWFLRFLNHENQFVAGAAFEAAMSSPFFTIDNETVRNFVVNNGSGAHRKAYVGRIAYMENRKVYSILYDWKSSNFFDFKVRLTRVALERSVELSIDDAEKRNGIKVGNTRRKIRKLAARYRSEVEKFSIRNRIPFDIEVWTVIDFEG